MFSPWKRGWSCRKSPSARSSARPEPAGEEAAPERAVRRRSRSRARGRWRGSRPRARASRASTRSGARRSGGRRARGGSSPAPPPRARGGGPCRRATSSAIAPTVSSIGVAGRRGAGSRGRSWSTPRRSSEASQALARTPGVPLMPTPDAVLAPLVAELRGEHDLVAAARDAPADEPLVCERAVHVGRVEEGDAELEGPVDRADRLALVRGRRRTRTCPCSPGRGRRRRGRRGRECGRERSRRHGSRAGLRLQDRSNAGGRYACPLL